MRVVMLSQSEWRHDSRVIREAESLAHNAFDVHVVCRTPSGSEPRIDRANGVTYHGLPHVDRELPRDTAALLRADLRTRVVSARRIFRGPRRRASLASAAGLLAGAAAILAAAPFALVAAPVLRSRRLRKSLERRWRRSGLYAPVVTRLQAPRYLNDFANRCANRVIELAPDVVHAHDLITLSAGASVSAQLDARLIYDAHELETHTNYHSLTAQTKAWIARYEATLIHECDAVITVCDSIADWLADAYDIRRPVVVMNSPLARNGTSPVAADIRTHLGLSGDTPLGVYVGSVTVDRGLELCVEALRHLPGVHLATVGWRYSETEARMKETAAANGVADRLHLIDPLPSNEVMAFIQSADVSVIPIQNVCLSYYFCFPNKLLESVFAGLPVVVADLAELRRFVDANDVGIVMDERRAESIAAAIAEAIAHRDSLKPTADEIARLQEAYGWEAQEARLLDLYNALGIKSRGQSPDATRGAESPDSNVIVERELA